MKPDSSVSPERTTEQPNAGGVWFTCYNQKDVRVCCTGGKSPDVIDPKKYQAIDCARGKLFPN